MIEYVAIVIWIAMIEKNNNGCSVDWFACCGVDWLNYRYFSCAIYGMESTIGYSRSYMVG